MSFCCIETWSVSVMVRFSALGRGESGGDGFCVVLLSFVGVREDSVESVPSAGADKEATEDWRAAGLFPLRPGSGGCCCCCCCCCCCSGCRRAVGDTDGVVNVSGLAVLGM